MDFGQITLYGKISGSTLEGVQCHILFAWCPRHKDHLFGVRFRTPEEGGGVSAIGGDRFKNIWTGVYREPALVAITPSILSYESTSPDVVDFHTGIPTLFKVVDDWDEFDALPPGPIG